VKTAKDSIALAADLSLPLALSLYRQVSAHVGVVKVGLSLFVAHGPEAVRALQCEGARVFLDLKLHDIPNTVELAAQAAGALGVSYLTVHASGGRAMLEAAVRGAKAGAQANKQAPPVVLAVTVLTSMDSAQLSEVVPGAQVDAHVERLAQLADESGVGGIVSSAHEVQVLKAKLRQALVYCTPGIRPAGADANDQSRVETPAAAIRNGASLLVVGRAISAAADPAMAARAIELEVTRELNSKDFAGLQT
jgi:orotidine-5'-phosphate decarboxylase